MCETIWKMDCSLAYPFGTSAALAYATDDKSVNDVVNLWASQERAWDEKRNLKENMERMSSCSSDISGFVQLALGNENKNVACCRVGCN